MKVKELQKTVNITWSPKEQHPIYLAAGTAAQQLDSNANSTLEIYSTNFSDASYDLKLKASLPSQFRFQKLIWSSTGFESTHPNGLIVGGCESGHIMIYSAAKMLANEEGLIGRQDKHTGPVSGLDVNPFQTNLLASCASESEIFIWDLNNTSTHMNPGAKTQPLEDVKNVAWNRQVQHILASVFSTRCVIWDLRKSEQIIKLSDTQSRVRWHALQWHPEVATQVWLASEDDQAPVVQLWDLRYATAPAKTMQIHQRGVLGMSWCPRDSDLMVSCGKDNRIYCWNPNTELSEGEILSEVATTATWYSDVQWCPRNPALIASSSLDGNVSIYSLFGGKQQQVQTSNKIADSFPGMDPFAQAAIPQQGTQIVYQDLKRAPNWIKKPCGVSFGFGGKLVSFNSKSKSLQISQVITEPELVERAKALEQSLNETNFVEYCRKKADEMSDQDGRYLWFFLKANFELNPKEEMLNLLGYNKDDIDQKFSKYVKDYTQTSTTAQEVDQLANRITNLTNEVDKNSIFEDIAAAAAAAQKQTNGEVEEKSKPQFKIPNGEHPDSLITEALLTGNLEAAVELCMDSKRIPEALIIASTAGIEFLTNIQKRVLQDQQGELSEVISSLVTRDWLDFVNRCTLDSWKEALIAALRHSERKAGDICERLGDRLLSERGPKIDIESTRNAMLCFVCAGSIDKLVSAWYQLKRLEQTNPNYKLKTNEMQELAEITMLMAKALEQQGIALDFNNRFGDFVKDYSNLLASQGALTAALTYIFAFGSHEHSALEELRGRIYNTVNYTKSAIGLGEYQQPQQMSAQKNIYSRHQHQQQPQQQPIQQRGSFSHAFPNAGGPISAIPNATLYPGGATGVAAQQNPYQNNPWNSNPTVSSTNIYNPSMQAPITAKAQLQPTLQPSFGTNESAVPHPPRPLSTSSSQSNATASASVGGSLLTRSKYVLDPSVVAPAPSMGGYGAPYYQQSEPAPSMPTSNFNTSPFVGSNILQPQAPSVLQPAAGYNVQSQQNVSAPPLQNIQRNPTPPPGWNDPPALKSTRAPKKVETASVAAPITHPLFGVDPNQNQNGYMDPNAAYQSPGGMMLPPPSAGAVNNVPSSLLTPMQPAPIGGNYMNPTASQNNNPPFPQQLNFQTSAIPTPQQPQQQVWNTQQQNTFETSVQQPIRQAEPPKEKPPLPEEYVYMQTVLEELKNQCLNAATDPRTKRKFVDVNKRLENLYDSLRDGRLTPSTIAALNQIIQFIQIGDYANALQAHTQIAFGSDFSQCAGFMPGLKVLIQLGNDFQILLR